MPRLAVTIFTLALLIVPSLALAQSEVPRVVRSLDLVTPPDSAVSGVAHIDDVRIGTRREVRIGVTTLDSSGELTFDGHTMRFADGYALVRETLLQTPALVVVRLTASAPDGSSESAVVMANLESGNATSLGFEAFSRLLANSADARAIARVLPQIKFPTVTAGRQRVSTSDCLVAVATFTGATLGTIGACSSGNVFGCGGGLIVIGTTVYKMSTSCPDNGAGDGTIGWG